MPARKKKAAKKAAVRKRRPGRPRKHPKDRRRRSGTPSVHSEMPLRSAPMRDPMDYCPACDQFKPLEEWAYAEGEKSTSEGAFLCRPCRHKPKASKGARGSELVPQLSGKDRRILRELVRCQNVSEVARRLDVSAATIHGFLKNRLRGTDVRGRQFYMAWRQLLETEGLDLLTIAKLMRLELHAMEPRWNKGEERWDFFPDHRARQAAAKWLAKMHGAVPPDPKTMIQVNQHVELLHNFDEDPDADRDVERTVDADFVIEEGV